MKSLKVLDLELVGELVLEQKGLVLVQMDMGQLLPYLGQSKQTLLSPRLKGLYLPCNIWTEHYCYYAYTDS